MEYPSTTMVKTIEARTSRRKTQFKLTDYDLHASGVH